MAETTATETPAAENEETVFEFGGLRFDISFRGRGATLRVLGRTGSEWDEMLRFDDFIENPHFHAPPAVQMEFDRSLGEPLAWYIAQVRDHLAEWMERAGYASLIPTTDFEEISNHADALDRAMRDCVPEGVVRVPGVGLQRV
jgi:hypothetical protein